MSVDAIRIFILVLMVVGKRECYCRRLICSEKRRLLMTRFEKMSWLISKERHSPCVYVTKEARKITILKNIFFCNYFSAHSNWD